MDTTKKRKGRVPIEGPTPVQQRMLAAIKEFISECGMSPTFAELGGILNIRTPNIHQQMTGMVTKGLVRYIPGKARTLELVEQIPKVFGLVSVPIIGVAAGGAPILAVENRIGEIWVEAHVIRGTCFALQVQGDSMVEANINDGDFVIVRQQPIAENGEIVVALLGDEATVKRLYVSDTSIELRPANPAYRPIRVEQGDELKILGKVLAVRNTTLSGDDS